MLLIQTREFLLLHVSVSPIFWMESKKRLSRFLNSATEIVKSEFLLDPGTMISKILPLKVTVDKDGLSKIFLMQSFQTEHALTIKLFLEISRLNLGMIILSIEVVDGTRENIEIGVLFFIILNSSVTVIRT